MVKGGQYKEDGEGFQLIETNKELAAAISRLSMSEEDPVGWVEFSILRGVDEKLVLDGPRLFKIENELTKE